MLTEVYAAVAGNDANTGAYDDPVRSLAGALVRVTPGGIIIALDPAEYGACTINDSVTIDAINGGFISVDNANAINVTATATKSVHLRGLRLSGQDGAGTIGINATGGAALYLDSMEIAGFRAGSALGINYAPPLGTAGSFMLTDVDIADCGVSNLSGGVLIKPNSSGSALAVLQRVSFSGKNSVGLIADGEGNQGGVNVIMRACSVAGCTAYGAIARSFVGSVTVLRTDDTLFVGNAIGVLVDGINAHLVTSQTTINRNTYGVVRSNSGSWWTFGNNYVNGNDSGNGSPTGAFGVS